MLRAVLFFVLAGLDPAIHALETGGASPGKDVDARNKSGHDDLFRSIGSRAGWKRV
jgi:hypothetical protein